MPIDSLPTPPSRSDSSNFAVRGDAFMAALPAFATQANALEVNVNLKEASAVAAAAATATDAGTASAAATAAAQSIAAVAWVSGVTYAAGVAVISPITLTIYRRLIAGAGTTDPSSDPTHWGAVVIPVASGGTGQTTLAGAQAVLGFQAGTRLAFPQAAAPTGWTQDTTDASTNRMLRVVNTTGGGTGGNSGHSPILMDVVPNHTHGVGTLATGNDTPDHAHTDSGHTHGISAYSYASGVGTLWALSGGNPVGATTGSGSANIGGATARHGHPISGSTASNGGTNWQPRYIDLIICAKN